MPTESTTQKFVLLPPRGVQTTETSNPQTASFLRSLHTRRATTGGTRSVAPLKSKLKMNILDSVHENGAKLVELSPQAVVALRAEQPGIRIVPVVYYYPAIAPRPAVVSRARAVATAAAGVRIVLKIVSQNGGTAIANADVVAFTDFANRVGASGKTNSRGEVSLDLGASSRRIERLFIFSQKGFWNGLRRNITITSGMEIPLVPIDLSFIDCLRFF